MHYNWLFALSVLYFGHLSLATPLEPHWDDMRVKHAWNALPPDWEHLSHPDAGTVIDLYIALKPRRENAMIDALYEVSTPGHPKYGAHLSREQVAGLVAPHPNTLELINSWLEHHGVPSSSVSTSHGGGWLTLTGVPVSQANALLGTSYQLYQHVETKDRILRTLSYALPTVLHGHVRTVAPTTYFDSQDTLRQIPRNGSSGAAARELVKVLSSRDETTPSDLRWRYKTSTYDPRAADQNVLAIAGFLGDNPNLADLTTFLRRYHTEAAGTTFTLVHVGGGDLPGPLPGDEANLEIQYTVALAYPTPHTYYTTVGNNRLLTWLNYMLELPTIPQTISLSYSADEKNFGSDLAIQLCRLFGQLGLRGSSVIISTGDVGVGRGRCLVYEANGESRVEFRARFPASCPYVTSVGGTMSIYDREVAASFSSGGFSNYFKRPEFQDAVVNHYLQNFQRRLEFGETFDGFYNDSSRGFPDIAAQAEQFQYFYQGEYYTLFGTGCSTPVVAAVISLLNDFLLSERRQPLGWLNPWLYSRGYRGIYDIQSGGNPGCGTGGFPSLDGWDPVTGLGTPNFIEMMGILYTDPDQS